MSVANNMPGLRIFYVEMGKAVVDDLTQALTPAA